MARKAEVVLPKSSGHAEITHPAPPPAVSLLPACEYFIAAFPKQSASYYEVYFWLKFWFDSSVLFTFDVGVEKFLSEMYLTGLNLRYSSREELLKYFSHCNMVNGGLYYPELIIEALLEDVEKARRLSLEQCGKELEKKVRNTVSLFSYFLHIVC